MSFRNVSLGLNFTNYSGSADELHQFSYAELILWFILYSSVAFLAVTGNGIVAFIIFTRPSMKTVTNYFIVNLAVADALTGLLAIPFKFQAALLQKWLLPHFMCKLVPFIETLTLSVSVFTLTGTAIDRLLGVVMPSRPRLRKETARSALIFIWVFSIGCSLPYGLFHNVVIPPWDPSAAYYVCMPEQASRLWWKVYNIYLTIIQYFVPLFIINGAYILIAYNVWVLVPPMENMDSNDRAFEKSKRKVVKMLVIVVAVFTFCWLPLETYLVLSEVRPLINRFRYINVIFFCCHWLAMSNSCLNPIIYGIYNEKYQREYRLLFGRCSGGRSRYCHESLESNHNHATRSLLQASASIVSLEMNQVNKHTVYQSYIASELGHD